MFEDEKRSFELKKSIMLMSANAYGNEFTYLIYKDAFRENKTMGYIDKTFLELTNKLINYVERYKDMLTPEHCYTLKCDIRQKHDITVSAMYFIYHSDLIERFNKERYNENE